MHDQECCDQYGIGDHDSVEHETRIVERESDDSGGMWTDDLGATDYRPDPAGSSSEA